MYDTVSRTFIHKGVSGKVAIYMPADAARVLVLIPSGKKITIEKGILKAGGLPIDFNYQKP